MYLENLDFVSAVKKIASTYGLEINDVASFDYEKNEYLKRSLQVTKSVKEYIREQAEKDYAEFFNNIKINRSFKESIRGISADLLNLMREKGLIKFYKTDKYATIKTKTFCSSAEVCGIQDIYKSSTGEWKKINNGRAGVFFAVNLKNITTLVLTESFFDSLSALEMAFAGGVRRNPFYTLEDLINDVGTVSINGSLSALKKEAILDILKNSDSLKTLVFGFDNDDIGQKYCQEIYKMLKENDLDNNYEIIYIQYPQNIKDLNELLQTKLQQQQPQEPKRKIKDVAMPGG
jgi:hypothetical protein